MANCWRCLIKYSLTSTLYPMAKKDGSYTLHSPPIPTPLTRCGANTTRPSSTRSPHLKRILMGISYPSRLSPESSWSSSGIALPAAVIHSQYSPAPPSRRTTRCYETSRIQSERYAILMFLWFPLPYRTGPVGEMSVSYTPPQGLCVLIYLCLSPLSNWSNRGTVFSHPPIASRNWSYYCFY